MFYQIKTDLLCNSLAFCAIPDEDQFTDTVYIEDMIADYLNPYLWYDDHDCYYNEDDDELCDFCDNHPWDNYTYLDIESSFVFNDEHPRINMEQKLLCPNCLGSSINDDNYTGSFYYHPNQNIVKENSCTPSIPMYSPFVNPYVTVKASDLEDWIQFQVSESIANGTDIAMNLRNIGLLLNESIYQLVDIMQIPDNIDDPLSITINGRKYQIKIQRYIKNFFNKNPNYTLYLLKMNAR